MRVSNYTVIKENHEVVVIKDIGPWDEYLSVTNNAEEVVKELSNFLGDRKLYCIDSTGSLGRILVNNGKFAGFCE